ncbi:hypothetical protein GCM10025881_33430 [Pseudolysinimonas kribbensis]|uniref:Aspartate/glutamate/uridylate kinase domain-containing protein n=1 Tax=Pseudolysinimonas kribbensis TaxID=433641 RepID=A0ABQ6KB38_9MICO|nr:hypothetical protein GCM10025881_33430 [Pseudolysinimonas kribbensis]
MTRAAVTGARRIVVKVGSSSISGDNAGRIAPLVDALAATHARGAEVVLVSSGAIATGMPYLHLEARPSDLATQQAAAAVGQNVLVFRYQQQLDRYAIVAGQVLLTAGDLENPTHRSNAQRAMERLLSLRILPIVNENDTVATHEIRFGDNDRLASMVSELVGADLLVLLSDVDALYTRPPARRVLSRSRASASATTSPGSSSAASAPRESAPGERARRSRRLASPPRPALRCSSRRPNASPRRSPARSSAPGSTPASGSSSDRRSRTETGTAPAPAPATERPRLHQVGARERARVMQAWAVDPQLSPCGAPRAPTARAAPRRAARSPRTQTLPRSPRAR